MTDDRSPDLTPPPDRPLPDQSRARIRADLLAATQADGGPARRWALPALAAAAVLVVAGLAGWAVRAGGDGGDGAADVLPTVTPSPATPRASEAPITLRPSLPPSRRQTTTTNLPVVPSGPGGHDVKDLTCAQTMRQTLPGARRVVTFPADDGGGSTTMWVAGERFALCDVRAGATTVQKPLPLTPRESAATYAVSSLYPPTRDGFEEIRVAGGPVPDGATAFDVTYDFPDGSHERATTVTDRQGRTWWRMLHSAPGQDGNELDQEPITVTVSYSGVQHTYRLHWGSDTCAQANHGC